MPALPNTLLASVAAATANSVAVAASLAASAAASASAASVAAASVLAAGVAAGATMLQVPSIAAPSPNLHQQQQQQLHQHQLHQRAAALAAAGRQQQQKLEAVSSDSEADAGQEKSPRKKRDAVRQPDWLHSSLLTSFSLCTFNVQHNVGYLNISQSVRSSERLHGLYLHPTQLAEH